MQQRHDEKRADEEQVVVVDLFDREIGTMGKIEAHKKGVLHRAISVCLFDEDGRWLLQKRALAKYHSPGLIANSCCSHPRKGEAPLNAASRRLYEELRIVYPLVNLRHLSTFVYREDVGQGMIEHENDYLFTGVISKELAAVPPNPAEVLETFWMTEEEIEKAIQVRPSQFTKWFFHIFNEVKRVNNKKR